MIKFTNLLIKCIFLCLVSGLVYAQGGVSCQALIESRPGLLAKVQSGCQQLYSEIINSKSPSSCVQPTSFRIGEIIQHVFFVPSKQQSCIFQANSHSASEFNCHIQPG